MVPFSFPQTLLKSRVMEKYTSSSATVGVWVLGAWGLELDVFILSCFPAFLILISVPVFPSFPSFPSVFKNRGSTVSIIDRHAGKTQKRLNEPNSKNANPLSNIDDFTNLDFFKK
jgi:hypothetical protein